MSDHVLSIARLVNIHGMPADDQQYIKRACSRTIRSSPKSTCPAQNPTTDVHDDSVLHRWKRTLTEQKFLNETQIDELLRNRGQGRSAGKAGSVTYSFLHESPRRLPLRRRSSREQGNGWTDRRQTPGWGCTFPSSLPPASETRDILSCLLPSASAQPSSSGPTPARNLRHSKTPFTRYSWLSNRLYNWTAGCQWMFVYTIQPVVPPVVKPVWQPVWQQVVSCKRGLTVCVMCDPHLSGWVVCRTFSFYFKSNF